MYLVSRPGARPVRVIRGLKDPLGLVWDAGRLYVSSVGRVTVYSDLRRTRFGAQRMIVHGPVADGENNALVLLPDGHFVMGVTADCDHCRPRSRFSGAIVSFKPDGSDLRVYAARIRAPVGLALGPDNGTLLVSMDQRDDLGAATRGDRLAVVAPGTDWRSPGCYGQGGSPCAGVPPVVAVLDKHAAVGPVVIDGSVALVSEWQTAKVIRVALARTGAGYRGSASTWLTGVDNPLALALEPRTGAVLVGDWRTGTIYRVVG